MYGVLVKNEINELLILLVVILPVHETLPLSTVKTSFSVSGLAVDVILLIQNLASTSS